MAALRNASWRRGSVATQIWSVRAMFAIWARTAPWSANWVRSVATESSRSARPATTAIPRTTAMAVQPTAGLMTARPALCPATARQTSATSWTTAVIRRANAATAFASWASGATTATRWMTTPVAMPANAVTRSGVLATSTASQGFATFPVGTSALSRENAAMVEWKAERSAMTATRIRRMPATTPVC